MFQKKTFVFIGKFTKHDLKIIKKRDLMNFIKREGGNIVTTISRKTNYVIFPQVILDEHKKNRELSKIKLGSRNIVYVNFIWVFNCLKEGRIISTEKYRINLNFQGIIDNDDDSYFSYNKENSFYENVIDPDFKIWIECKHPKYNRVFFYNILNNSSTYTPSLDFKKRRFGNYPIIDKNYYSTENQSIIIKELINEKEVLKKNLEFLIEYEKKFL